MGIRGKVCIITGAYGGLGLALAEKLASEGALLEPSGRDEAKLNRVAEKLEQSTQVTAVRSDLTKVRDCKRVMDACVASHGRIDMLINNAGVLEDGLKPRLVDKIIDTNLKGTEYCTFYALSQMKKQEEGGVIVNVSSTSGVYFKPKEDEAVYASSKFGVMAYSACLYMAHKESKIRIVCFCPGGMKTDLFRVAPERMLPDFMDPKSAAGVLIEQLKADKQGLFVLKRRGEFEHSRDFSMVWNWTEHKILELSRYLD